VPIYEYDHLEAGECGRFEVVQRMADAPLATCPTCGKPVQRAISVPAVLSEGRSGDMLSNKNLAAKGFTKYVKAGDGVYEKTAGKGPNLIKK
jgi:putative FmdB family regulatory protein